jgi:3-phenylpropionate/cinnamic acid dioxygenase small subunit
MESTAMTATTEPIETASREDVESLLLREAHLLDTGAYDAWLELWAPQVRYWVPGPSGAPDQRHVAIVDDDRAILEDRVFRMKHPASHAVDPAANAVRIVGNIVVEQANGSAVEVRSAYVLVANRSGDQTTYAARQRHRLVHREGGLAIAVKRVDLTCGADALRNLVFLP